MATRKKSRKKSVKDKSVPIRDVIKVSPHRVTGGGSIEDLTIGGDVLHESPNEKKAIPLLSLCHDVVDFRSQGSREPYVVDGKTHEHIPDFNAHTTFASNLRIELKSLESLMKDSNLEKAVNIGRGYRERGEPFAFLVDAQIEQEPMFSNVHLLARYVTSKPRDEALLRVTTLLSSGGLPISAVMQQANLELVDIYTLIARRHLCIDMSQPLNAESLVSLPNQPFKGLSLENILRSTRFGHLLERLALGHRPTDKPLMEAAKDWRQRRRPNGVFNFVGGF
jgi:hypothetical protein